MSNELLKLKKLLRECLHQCIEIRFGALCVLLEIEPAVFLMDTEGSNRENPRVRQTDADCSSQRD